MTKTTIELSDLTLPNDYIKIRKQAKKELVEYKKYRRVEIGPVATCYFESFQTMVHQINEMLYIEKGGEEQIQDELNAYATMVPNGSELTATVMFEIDDPIRRKNFLARLGGIEETMFIRFSGHKIMGIAEADIDRTTADGKASSVHFLHFPFTADQIKDFKSAQEIIIGFGHANYGHMVMIAPETHQALSQDFI